ncbi:hypothetical protein [Gracilibacillus saliphilus]|uniref:hypothetical protein n=1 Tax=Gracilibacillus saliphilus TaxID=543890 RepID=UPI0018789D80|nr:hypothetical protein [Gracilibacillus saliphilus]
MKMKAYNLKRVDIERDMHLQAWLNHQVTATKEQGKKHVPVYKNFTDFFDYEKRVKEIENPTKKLNPQQRKMAYLAKKANGKGVKYG